MEQRSYTPEPYSERRLKEYLSANPVITDDGGRLGVVSSVVPGIQAAYVDIGFNGKHGFLYVSDLGEDLLAGGERPQIEKLLKRGQILHVHPYNDNDEMGAGIRLRVATN